MKKLKLNQLNKQNLVESEMNAINGGIMNPVCSGPMQHVASEWKDFTQMDGCGGGTCKSTVTSAAIGDVMGACS